MGSRWSMAKRCGCASQDCSCTITAGDGIQVTGTGSKTNPYVVTLVQTSGFTVADSASVDLTLSGAGTVDDPTVLTAVATLTIPSVSITTYTTPGTASWTRPTGKSIARVTCIGAGGGGGSGRRDATSTVRSGGGGGSGGAAAVFDFYVTDLPAKIGRAHV